MPRPEFVSADIFIPETPRSSSEVIRIMRNRIIKRLPPSIVQPLKAARKFIRERQEIDRTISIQDVEAIFRFIGNSTNSYLSTDYEKDFAQAIINAGISQGSSGIFYDIGAAQGFYTIFMKQIGNTVIAFEPDDELSTDLFTNLALNIKDLESVQLGTMFLYPMALGDSERTISFYTGGRNGFAPSLSHTHPSQHLTMIPMTALDTIVTRDNLPYPTIVKIDVEGAEKKVLEGGDIIFSSDAKPEHVFIEIHTNYLPLFNSNPQEVWGLFTQRYGYTPQMVIERNQQLLCHFQYNT